MRQTRKLLKHKELIYHLQTKTTTKNEVAMTEALSVKTHYCKFCAHQYVDDHDLQVHLLEKHTDRFKSIPM